MDKLTLVANIIPRIDKEEFRKEMASAFDGAFRVNVSGSAQGAPGQGGGGGSGNGGNGTGGGSTSTSTSTGSAINQGIDKSSNLGLIENVHQFRDAANESDNVSRFLKGINKSMKNFFVQDEDDEKTAQNKQSKQLSIIAGASSKLAGAGMSLMKNSFGVLEEIYNKLKAASPLLQTIESLFNLAMTLFFMPLGNKLAEVLLPATLELVDAVVDMWDSFEDMTLSEMFTTALEYGIGLLADYFKNIGAILSEQGGLLGSIGNMLISIGDFIEGSAYKVLESLFTVVSFVVEHLKTIISLVTAFYAMQYAANIMSMYVTATSSTLGGWFGAGILAAGVGTAALTYAGLSVMGLAEGGYVPAREGGTLAIIGEGGEGEYVVPESKTGSMGGTYITNNFYGYTNDDIIQLVRDETNSQISLSRLKGGF